MKFPYGISDFKLIITEEYFYCDRTDRIPLIEDAGRYLLFIRPRRFGKSLLLSMLANYYDVAKKDEFDALFGHLKIGKTPSPLRNRFFILEWDFSNVDPIGDVRDIRRSLHNQINAGIRSFLSYYEDFQLQKVTINESDATVSIQSLLDAVRKTSHQIYLLIDEYDNFANEVMMGGGRDREGAYEALVHKEGPLKTLFKVVKSSTKASLFDRIFITGVSPVVMSDITSGYNIAENIYTLPYFNDLCGFTKEEVNNCLELVEAECGRSTNNEAFALMRTYYNGYTFTQDSEEQVFNPTLAIYFMKMFLNTRKYPRKMLDANLSADDAKLRYIAKIPGGSQLLLDLLDGDRQVVVSDLADRFGIREMLADQSKDRAFLASFLYYFGVLTIAGETPKGKLRLRVPNLVMNGLYVERIQQMLLPDPMERDDGKRAAEALYATGDMAPLCEFVEERYFNVFHNPDYKWANELTVKTAFLTLLHDDILYIMDSEEEIGKGYADLTMIIRPDKRRFEILDILIEFKYVKLGAAGLTAERARELSTDELQSLPPMASEMKSARKQVKRYGDALEKKYGNALRLRRYAVVSLGFERLWWEEVG
ncbi:MAG: AAA family ATPase [Desulfobacterales bacterium]|nr:AAA family ATPase [Desulfobacterales bacterium]